MAIATRRREAFAPTPRAGGNYSLRALALYASIVGRQAGVEVIFGNYPTAATNGKQIFMPNLQALGDERWLPILKCLIDHEIMHVRQTKFEAAKGCNSPLSMRLANILEDCWGEREQAKVYPGSLRSIRAGMDELVKLDWFGPPSPDMAGKVQPVGLLLNWLLHDLRGRHFVMPNLIGWAQQWRALAEMHFDSVLLDEIQGLMHQVDTCTDSYRAVQIANEVVDLLRQAQQALQDQAQQQKEQQQQKQRQDQQGQAGEAGQSEGEAGPQGQGESSPTRPDDRRSDQAQKRETSTPGDGEPDEDRSGLSADQDDPTGEAQGGAESGQAEGEGAQAGQDGSSQDDEGRSPGQPPQDASQPGSGSQGAPYGAEDKGTAKPSDASSADSGSTGSGSEPSSQSASACAPSGESAGQSAVQSADQAAPGGTGGGWLQSPEELEALADALQQVLEAGCAEMPSTEMADALTDTLKDKGLMRSSGPPDFQAKRHAECLAPGAADRISETSESWGSCAVEVQQEADTRKLAGTIERKLGAKLRDMLETRVQSQVTYGRRGQRLGAQRVSRTRSGNFDVFRRTEEGDDLSTAISLIVDMSGSMRSALGTDFTRKVAAGAAAYAVGETLSKFDVPFSWVNFGDYAQSVKRFSQSWRKRRTGALLSDLGGTELDAPLLLMLPELAERTEERKLFLVVTDGEPSNEDAVVASLALMPMLGVEVSMLFIGEDGGSLERQLRVRGMRVARAIRPEDLAAGIFSAVENAFI